MTTSGLLKLLAIGISITVFLTVGLLTSWSILNTNNEIIYTLLFCTLLGFYIYNSSYLFDTQRSEESKLSFIGIYGVLGLVPVALSLAALISVQHHNQNTILSTLLATLAVSAQIILLIFTKIILNIIDKAAIENNYRSEHIKWKAQINELHQIAELHVFRIRLAELAETVNYLTRANSEIDPSLIQNINQHIENIKISMGVNDLSMFTLGCNELEKSLKVRENFLNLSKQKI